MTNDDNVIDGEVVEIVDNLPAVAETTTYRSDDPIQGQRDWLHGPSPERRCVAHRKNGDPCKNAALKGAKVCRYHGGAAPQVRAAARARLDNAADLMAQQLLGVALSAESEAVKLAAIRDALDRTIGKAPTVVEVGPTKAFEDIFTEIGGTPPDEFQSVPGGYGSAGGYPSESFSPPFSSAHSAQPNPATSQREERDQASTRENPDSRDSRDSPNIDGRYGNSVYTGEGSRSGDDAPPPRPRRRDSDRDTHAQAGGPHITGEAAMRAANRVNQMNQDYQPPPMRQLDSPHKRYRRP